VRRKTLLIFVLLALTSIIGIVVIQVYWFKKAYDNNQEEFNKNVHIALKEVVKGIIKYNNTTTMPSNPVEQINPNYFVVMVNDQINAQVLKHYLQLELNRFNIKQGFEFSIYDCANKKIMYGEYASDNSATTPLAINQEPVRKGDNYYFTVYFPHKTSSLVRQMNLWIYSSAIVVVVVIFFIYSLFVILKQRRLSEIQRDFINNMAHEIRTPLSTISVSAQTIKNPDIINTPQRLLNYATIIMDEANKLRTQLERVLSIAETETNIKLNVERIDVHELLMQTTSEHIRHITPKKITLNTNLHAKSYQLNGDTLHIKNLFANLIDNAIKYSKQTLNLNVTTLNNQNGYIEIHIADDGVGISKENQKRIFDKFYRVPTGNVHNTKGFGIGLSYVYLITKMHKGSIKVLSELNHGTTFIITLPLA
jgi:two-component system, OmpR family, phosphate regulon sensor histidine kinase PhoR